MLSLLNSSVSHEMLTPIKCIISLCKKSIQNDGISEELKENITII